jgi:hypothetical protein
MGKSVQGEANRNAGEARAPNGNGKPTSGTAVARHNGRHGGVQFRSRFSKMADMILHDNNCDGNGRASGTAAPVRAALTDAGVNFLAFPGSRLAEPSAGFTR